jgi:nitroreductase
MELLDVIRSRRTAKSFLPTVPPREVIEEMLEAAVWAPNHRMSEPWRFFVFAGAAREALGRLMADDLIDTMPDADESQRAATLEAQLKKATRSPIVIAVTCDPPTDPRVLAWEDLSAVSCAIQNMLLVAEARGLATRWSTGIACDSRRVRRHLGLGDDVLIVGYIYAGYAAAPVPVVPRTPAACRTVWLES